MNICIVDEKIYTIFKKQDSKKQFDSPLGTADALP
jgi:hypothetical protein